jgi:hypothetical protein
MDKKINLKQIVDQRGLGALFMWFNFKILIQAYRWFGKKRDGWRKTTEANHRPDAARYIGSLKETSDIVFESKG